MRHDSSNRSDAFTIIELLMVFAMIAILAGFSALGVTRTVKRTALSASVGAIRDCATQAQLQALRCPPGPRGECYGTVVAVEADGRAWTALVRGGPGDGKATHAEREIEGTRRWLKPHAQVWVAGEPLVDSTAREVAWYYQPGTGVTVSLESSGFVAGASVGIEPPVLSYGSGRLWGAAPDTSTPAVARPAAGAPGLSLRSKDGQVRHALAVYATGTFAAQEW